jgi:hypothetical protein
LNKSRPRERQLIDDSITVFGDTRWATNASQDPLSATLADGMSDGSFAIKASVLALRSDLARCE